MMSPIAGHRFRRRGRLASALCVSAALVAPPAIGAPPTEQAGVSSAVRGTVARASTLNGGSDRQNLEVGSEVYMQDRISSQDRSLAQLLLLDQSTFKLGPDSSVVIDEFIYDPEQGTGEMVVEAASGVFRFISGAIGRSDPDDVQIETPLGSLGVRGTMVTVKIARDADGNPVETLYLLNGPGADNNALARRGAIQVSAQGSTVTVQRAGWGTFVRPGEPPSPPQPIPSDVLDQLDGQLAAAPSSGTGPDESAFNTTIQAAGIRRITGETTAQTRDRGETASRTEQSNGNAREVASGDNLTDFQVPSDHTIGPRPPEGMEPTPMPDPGPATEFGDLQTFAGLRGASSGTASASQTGIPLYQVSDIENLQNPDVTGGTGDLTGLADLSFQGIPAVGSYDVSFSVDFSSKTFSLSFENIDLQSFDVAGALQQTGGQIPEGEITAIFSATSNGANVETVGGCQNAICTGIVAALTDNERALSGILSALSAGTEKTGSEVIGVSVTGAE